MKRSHTILFFLLAFFLAAAVLQTTGGQHTRLAPVSRIIDSRQLLLDIETLSSDEMQGRSVGTAGGAKAREYVVERFRQSGLKAFGDSYLHPFEAAGREGEKLQGVNIIGYIRGKQKPEKYLVVTAHYDHVGVRKGEIYNGADDNASGTAALFAMAKYFSKNRPAHSVIFAALDAEEAGLQGARKFVAAPPVEKDAIVMNVNMDMISRSAAGELYAAGTYHYPFLRPYLEEVAKKTPVKLLLGHDRPSDAGDDWTNQSDHGAFHQAKIPFIYFGVEDHKDYHRPTDDFANIDQTFYVRAVETVLAAVKSFDANLREIEKQKSVVRKE